MAKYEIMLIVSGSLDEKKAKTVANDIASSIKSTKPSVEEYGLKEMAYKIKKDTHGYYFQYNFETDEPKLINEFRRLSGINKNVLRLLIINLEKDYGYRATINTKKIERNKKRLEIYTKRKTEYEKMKEARQAEYLKKESSFDESADDSKEVKTKKTTAKRTTIKEEDQTSKEKKETKSTTRKKTTKKETN